MGSSQRLPNFLIIGAMKAGTTTLYRDLYEHPQIFFPEIKEPENLTTDDVLTPAGRAAYARLYRRAPKNAICGDASTAYSKRPDIEGVARRAKQCLGSDVKIIYMYRDPIARIVSQHHHEYLAGLVGRDINREVVREQRFLNYSRYFYQIRPWLTQYGRERIFLLPFEAYVQERRRWLNELASFLGVRAEWMRPLEGKRFNASADKRIPDSRLRRYVIETALYRYALQPILPWRVRGRLKTILVPPSQLPPPAAMDAAVRNTLLRKLRKDYRAFLELTRQAPSQGDTPGDLMGRTL